MLTTATISNESQPYVRADVRKALNPVLIGRSRRRARRAQKSFQRH